MRVVVAVGILCDAWIAFGLGLDEIYHVSNKNEVFWTTPHLIIYSGMAMLFIGAVWSWLRTCRHRKCAPMAIAAFGIIPFMMGAAGDTVLHVFLQVPDESILGRPTHLLILEGLVILLFSQVRSTDAGQDTLLEG